MNKVIYDYKVEGMHCAGCELYLEEELKKNPNILDAKATLSSNSLKIEFKNIPSIESEITLINKGLEKRGYKVVKESTEKINLRNLFYAILISILFIFVYTILQNLGVTKLLSNINNVYIFAFTYGVVASLSTCMAVVGSVVLTLSAAYSKSESKVIPMIIFHIARLLTFFLLGAALGYLGQIITLNETVNLILNITLFIVMIVLGLSMLNISPVFNGLQLRMPKVFAKSLLTNSKSISHIALPIFLGFITFFLPCGFTQSMQFQALATKDPLISGIMMGIFALGTLPILLIMSFTSVSLSNSKYNDLFYKVVGILIVIMSTYTFYLFIYTNIIALYI